MVAPLKYSIVQVGQTVQPLRSIQAIYESTAFVQTDRVVRSLALEASAF
jgi:hypothetical protein